MSRSFLRIHSLKSERASPRKLPSPRDRPGRDEGRQGVQGRAALLRAEGRAGLVGQHVRRPEGPADRLRPVRQALPRHAAADRRQGRRHEGREDRRRRSARRRGCSGRSTASTSSSTAASSTRAACTASPTRTATTSSTRSRCSARFEAAAASTARTPSLAAPDGKSLYVVCGNQTKLDRARHGSLVPPVWGEDHLLPRMPDGNGFMTRRARRRAAASTTSTPTARTGSSSASATATRTTPPSTATASCSPTTPTWSGTSTRPGIGRRASATPPAAASSAGATARASGRPTTPTACPPVVNIGPGSPTGVVLRLRREVPGEVPGRAVHLRLELRQALRRAPDARGQRATRRELEEFVTGTPLPLTDVVVNPTDGAMYFAIGGRKTQSGLYRVTYTGKESDRTAEPAGAAATDLRGPRSRGTSSRRSTASQDPAGRRGRLAVPRQRRPLHPVRRPGRRSSTRTRNLGREGAQPRKTRRRAILPCWPWSASPRRTRSTRKDKRVRRPTRPSAGEILDVARPRSTCRSSPTSSSSTCSASTGPLQPLRPPTRRAKPRRGSRSSTRASRHGNRERERRAAARCSSTCRTPTVAREDDEVARATPRRRRSRSSTPAPCGCSRPAGRPNCARSISRGSSRPRNYKGGNSFGGFLKNIKDDAVAHAQPDAKRRR